MKLKTWMTLATSVFVLAACDSGSTTAPATTAALDAQFDAVDPVVTIFNSTYGLPAGPFGGLGAAPFLGGLPMPAGAGVQAPPSFGPAAGVGAPLPDSLKLTDAQKTQIQTLVNSFQTANRADIDIMIATMMRAHAAKQAGKSAAEIKAILDAAKPAADRVRANSDALRAAIQGVLTAAQRAWIESHKPTVPFRMGG